MQNDDSYPLNLDRGMAIKVNLNLTKLLQSVIITMMLVMWEEFKF